MTSINHVTTGQSRSTLLRRHDDDPRVFRELHRGIEGTHQAVLHDTRHGYRAPAVLAEVSLHRRGGSVRGQFQGRDVVLSGDLLVPYSTPNASLVGFGGRHGLLSISRDHKDRRFA